MATKCKAFFDKYKHFLILTYFIFYLAWFFYIEKTITTHFHVIYMPIDDYIPFCEIFIVPYLLWFGYVAWGILYTGLKNKTDFYKLCAVLMTGMTIFLIVSTLYPNGHFLRPICFERDNIFTDLCKQLYTTDTSTNLFPSIHVYNSLAVHFAVMNSENLKHKKYIRIPSAILAASIVLATMFLKQHSVFDVLTAFALAFVMYQIVYVKRFEPQSVRSFASKKIRTLRQQFDMK